MNRTIITSLLTLLIVATTSKADRRMYAWTYQYSLTPSEATEVELYQTTHISELDSWEYRLEFEHGLTEDFDLAVYQIFAQPEGGNLTWDAFQIRTRLRLADPGAAFLDPLLYLEYGRPLDLKAKNKFEAKLILARDFDRINFSVNPLYELAWAPGEPKHEVGADVGLSLSPSFSFSMGIETLIRYEMQSGEESEFAAYAGPSMSYASGSLFYNVGYVVGLTDEGDDARVRFLMGIGI